MRLLLEKDKFDWKVYCGQTAGWIKMPLGTEVGLGPGYIVLDGDPALPHWKGTAAPHFLAHVYCGQTVAHLTAAEHFYKRLTKDSRLPFLLRVRGGCGPLCFRIVDKEKNILDILQYVWYINFRPMLSGARSDSTVRSQVWRGRPDWRFQSPGKGATQAVRALLWSVDGSARAMWPKNLRRVARMMWLIIRQWTSSLEMRAIQEMRNIRRTANASLFLTSCRKGDHVSAP